MPSYSVHKLPVKQTWRRNYIHAYTYTFITLYTAYCVGLFRKHQIVFMQIDWITFTHSLFVCRLHFLMHFPVIESYANEQCWSTLWFTFHLQLQLPLLTVYSSISLASFGFPFFSFQPDLEINFSSQKLALNKISIVIDMSTGDNQSQSMERYVPNIKRST